MLIIIKKLIFVDYFSFYFFFIDLISIVIHKGSFKAEELIFYNKKLKKQNPSDYTLVSGFGGNMT